MSDDITVRTPSPRPPPHADAFTAFMHAYQDMVFTTAARLAGSDETARDIAQEVFLRAYQHFDALRESPRVGGWLKTVTTNLTLNHLMRYRKRWRFLSELFASDSALEQLEALEALAPTAALDAQFRTLDAAERQSQLERALADLPVQQRVPLVLYHFEDMPYQQIASQLGISLAKVKTDILRGRLALARRLAGSELAPQPGVSS